MLQQCLTWDSDLIAVSDMYNSLSHCEQVLLCFGIISGNLFYFVLI